MRRLEVRPVPHEPRALTRLIFLLCKQTPRVDFHPEPGIGLACKPNLENETFFLTALAEWRLVLVLHALKL